MAKKPTAIPPPESGNGPITSQPGRSYVASSTDYRFYIGDRALSQNIDDVEKDFGIGVNGIYSRMLNEPVLAGIVDGLIMSAIEPGMRFSPRFSIDDNHEPTPEQEADAKEACRVADYAQTVIDGLDLSGGSFKGLLYDLLLAVVYGHRLAEATTRLATTGEFAGYEVLETATVKPRENYAFVLDEMNRFRGVMAIVPGVSLMIRNGFLFDAAQFPNVLPPEKLITVTVGGREGNPQGRSWFRSAYSPWFEKQLGRAEELKYIAQHAGGKITGTTPENATSYDPEKTPEMEMVDSLSNLSNGGVAAFPYGSQITVHYPASTTAFGDFADRRDREMTLAVAKQIRATLEAKHGSKADSSTAENQQDKVHNYLRNLLVEAIVKFLRALIRRNLGELAATKYFPVVSMATVNNHDFATDIAALGSVGYTVDESQFEAIDRRYEIGKRAAGWRDRQAAEKAKAAAALPAMNQPVTEEEEPEEGINEDETED
jgi:hypothetical protein